MPQPVQYDDRGNLRAPYPDHHDGILEQIEDTTRSMGDSASTLAGDLTSAVKERPYTTLAIAAGLAFAVGALWKLSHRQPPSRIDRLRAQLPDVPRARELQRWLQSQDMRAWLPQDMRAWLPKGWR
jgi:hypothetical protein